MDLISDIIDLMSSVTYFLRIEKNPQPEKQMLKLSDLYMPKETEPVLEL